MIKRLAQDMTFWLIKKRYVDIEYREIYTYGLEVILLNGLNLILLFVISLLFNAAIHYIVFLITFIPLRVYGGGYHAKTSYNCVLLTCMGYLLTILIKMRMELWIGVILLLPADYIILKYAPIINENNKIGEALIIKNRKRSRLFLAINHLLIFIFYWAERRISLQCIIFTICISILEIIPIIHNKISN